MESDPRSRIRPLLDRLQRLVASQDWSDDLNPAQRSALGYLAKANRFSRSPSHVADYLCTTRGTASQTLKSLEKKGLIERNAQAADKRSVSYDVTRAGRGLSQREDGLDRALEAIGQYDGGALEQSLSKLLRLQLEARQFRSFGQCRTCRYHEAGEKRAYCRLLDLALQPDEWDQLCHEHSFA